MTNPCDKCKKKREGCQARQKGIELEEQQDMAVLAKLTGGRA